MGCDFSAGKVNPLGVPLLSLVNFDEDRKRYVIKKQLVPEDAPDYQAYLINKKGWVKQDVGFPRKEVFEIPNRVQLDYLGKESN